MKRPNSVPGTPPPQVSELVRAEDRLSFVYFEHCVVDREDNSVTITTKEGKIALPAAALSVLLLGPGTSVTHQAMQVMGENGAMMIWVGERGVRMYSFGSPLTHSSAMIEQQARLVSNERKRLAVARKMYEMRFPGEDFSGMTMQQLRGREGARVRSVYRKWSRETGVAWDKRTYNHEDFDDATQINQALSAANTCLYGICHAVILALGCSPALGFIHVGHERSFVFDVADLYKAEISIPVAFQVTAKHPDDIGSAVRHAMRDKLYDLSIMKRVAADIRMLFGMKDESISSQKTINGDAGGEDGSDAADSDVAESDSAGHGEDDFGTNLLWDPHGDVPGGRDY
jgi:CRISPR-associated protein Cas1